jgi:hypothetical protein
MLRIKGAVREESVRIEAGIIGEMPAQANLPLPEGRQLLNYGIAFDARFHSQVKMRQAQGVEVDLMFRAALAVGPAVAMLGGIAYL